MISPTQHNRSSHLRYHILFRILSQIQPCISVIGGFRTGKRETPPPQPVRCNFLDFHAVYATKWPSNRFASLFTESKPLNGKYSLQNTLLIVFVFHYCDVYPILITIYQLVFTYWCTLSEFLCIFRRFSTETSVTASHTERQVTL